MATATAMRPLGPPDGIYREHPGVLWIAGEGKREQPRTDSPYSESSPIDISRESSVSSTQEREGGPFAASPPQDGRWIEPVSPESAIRWTMEFQQRLLCRVLYSMFRPLFYAHSSSFRRRVVRRWRNQVPNHPQPLQKAAPPSRCVLLKEEEDRKYNLFPIRWPDVFKFKEEHEDAFWTVKEIDMAPDKAELKLIKPDGTPFISEAEYDFILRVLSFFASADFIVADNMMLFTQEVQAQEAVMFYQVQIHMENIHSETYGLLVDVYARSEQEKKEMQNAVFSCESVKGKAQWAERWMDTSKPFAQRLLAFAIVEGVFFSASFASIFWFKKQGKLLNGLCKSNEFIARDEGIHTRFALHLYKEYIPEEEKLTQQEVHSLFQEAYELECAFIKDAIPVALLGMNVEQMAMHIQSVIDFWLKSINVEPMFGGASTPFDWMEMLSLEGKTNFFEARVTEYTMADLRDGLNFDADF